MGRIIVLCLLLLPVCAQAQEKAPPPPRISLEELLAKFAKAPGLEARFREEKHMALLAAPLINEGKLHFAPPARAARHVLTPSRQTVLIDKDAIRMGDGEHTETLSLKGNPVLRQFLDSFMKVFSGDKAGLEESYELTFSSEGTRWELSLKPRRSPMKDAIASVAFAGDDLVMKTLTIAEVGGDKSVTTFSEVDPNRTYTKDELETLFRLPAKGKSPR